MTTSHHRSEHPPVEPVAPVMPQSPPATRRALLDLAPAEIEATLADLGQPRYRSAQITRWALARGLTSFKEMSNLPKELIARLDERFTLAAPRVITSQLSDDGQTTKALLELDERSSVEAVHMRYDPEHIRGRARSTVCVSTQAGCAMGCVFCATGKQGLTRNLSSAEILAQVLHFHRGEPVRNVVFMGMGEPLANYDATLRAVRWLIDPDGMNLRQRSITISTIGLLRAVERLAGEQLQIGLTISLHAPDDALRHELIPTSRGVSIRDLVAAGRNYVEQTGRRVTFAYALLGGVNDHPSQARRLARQLGGFQCHVNLIPYNPIGVPELRRPSRDAVRAFQRELQGAGVNATVRIERGVEIAAACGQLRTDVALGRR